MNQPDGRVQRLLAAVRDWDYLRCSGSRPRPRDTEPLFDHPVQLTYYAPSSTPYALITGDQRDPGCPRLPATRRAGSAWASRAGRDGRGRARCCGAWRGLCRGQVVLVDEECGRHRGLCSQRTQLLLVGDPGRYLLGGRGGLRNAVDGRSRMDTERFVPVASCPAGRGHRHQRGSAGPASGGVLVGTRSSSARVRSNGALCAELPEVAPTRRWRSSPAVAGSPVDRYPSALPSLRAAPPTSWPAPAGLRRCRCRGRPAPTRWCGPPPREA